ncbi:glycosyl hydrolase family 65 protein [Gordonia sp. CPCC 205515]|uniref:glycosyl hydrolase family 65 protein n=1 Tax=Gordonia sp. CPCC 205515 TaxID=3140791 RepID=UPI003AF33A63
MSAPAIDIRHHDAVIFGVDSVISDTDATEQVSVLPSAVELGRRLQDAGIALAGFATSQQHTEIIESAGGGEILIVPADPATDFRDRLLEAARRIGVAPARTVVLDATGDGVRAARRVGFGLVIGIGPADTVDTLRDRGADAVVADPSQIEIRSGFTRVSRIPEAINSRYQLTARIRDRMPVVVLDFDGTIAPTRASATPGAAADELVAGMREQIVRVAGLCPVAVISRRDVADLRARVRVDGIWYAGRDGRQLLDPDGARHDVESEAAEGWDRGRALHRLLGLLGDGTTTLPIYVGDGIVDEAAFDALPSDSIGIVVRQLAADRRSSAEFAVADPDGVRELLQRLADLVGSAPELAASANSPWTVVYHGYDPATEKLRESLCSIGNGVFGTRGAVPCERADDTHYPGTYGAGIFNRLEDQIDGHTIDNESMVNLPNWLSLTFRIDDGPWFDIDDADLLDYQQALDVRRSILTRRFRFRDAAGRITDVSERRLMAMHLPHACALETTITPHGWSGRVEFRSLLDGAVTNSLVARYRELASTHLEAVAATELSDDAVVLEVRTNQSGVPVAMAARNLLWDGQERLAGEYRLVRETEGAGERIGHDIAVDAHDGRPVTLEKVVTVFTGRDPAISEPAVEAARWLDRLGRFDELLDGHVLRWGTLWDRFDIAFEGRDDVLRIVRFHLMQVLQTLSPNTTELDVGVPARGLNGEAYRGHIFWDELYVFPVLNLRMPTLTRSLLRYRYLRMSEAQAAATEAGHRGAMFPWQSGSDGREESQQLHLNPDSGHWNPDPSRRQIHIGIAVAYNVWQYYQVTGDVEFLVDYGAEMLIEIARYYASLADFDESRGRYVIRGVIGPDEFHGGYPDKPYDGVDNNAYTNVMAVWLMRRAAEVLTLLPLGERAELTQRLGLQSRETDRWQDITRRMFVPFHDDVISQFEGYEALAELNWDAYREKYGNIARLDRILEAEDDDVNAYRASKQADVVMLFYVLSDSELRDLFERMGYKLSDDDIRRTIDYYMARTSHGSTLSRLVHSGVLARTNRPEAMEFFDDVLRSDIEDIQGGTTEEGIHLAAMAGSVDLLQRCFTGLETRGNRLILRPHWPDSLGALEFAMIYRGHRLRLRISSREVQVTAAPGSQAPIQVECRGEVEELRPGGVVRWG